MNSYEKLLNEITEKISMVTLQIQNVEERKVENDKEIKKQEQMRDNIDSSAIKVRKQIYLLKNYIAILKNNRIIFAKNLITKSFILIALDICFNMIAFNTPINFFSVIVALMAEFGIVVYEKRSYDINTEELKTLKRYITSEELEAHLSELEVADRKCANEINKRVIENLKLNKRISGLEKIKSELIISTGILHAKKSALEIQLIVKNEEHFNEAFASDEKAIDILRLERSLNDGKNIWTSTRRIRSNC